MSLIFFLACSKPFADDLPEKCPKNNSFSLITEKVQNFQVKQAWYSTWNGSDGSLVFTNYDDYNPSSIYGHSVTGSEARVVIQIARADNKTLEPGIYTSTYQKEEKPSLQAKAFNVSSESLSDAIYDTNATIEFYHIGPKYTCGKFQAKDSRGSIQGEFVSHFHQVQ